VAEWNKNAFLISDLLNIVLDGVAHLSLLSKTKERENMIWFVIYSISKKSA
jgi:hypothetical protein